MNPSQTLVASGRVRRPSWGLVILGLSLMALSLFLVWGLRQPELDRVWELEMGLRSGQRTRLTRSDRALLEANLMSHPGLAERWLDRNGLAWLSAHQGGWLQAPRAFWLRAPTETPARLHLEVQTPGDLLPVRLELRGQGWEQIREVRQTGPIDWELPRLEAGYEVIELEVRGKAARRDPSVLAIRVTW